MKTFVTYFDSKPTESDGEGGGETTSINGNNNNSNGIVNNFRRNLGNAWHTLAYGKWRRREDILEDCNSQIWLLGRCYLPEGQGKYIFLMSRV